MPGAAIVGTWEQGEIEGAAAEEFTDFSITISTTDDATVLDYSTENTYSLVFPESGEFTEIPAEADFTNGAQVTNGSTPTDITLVSETQLRMVFTVDANSGLPADNAKTAEIGGEYTFTLTKAAE